MSLKEEIQKQISEHKVMIYSKTTCPYCTNLTNLFKGMGIEFEILELDKISNGPAIQDALFELTNQRTVPNAFIGGTHVQGFSEIRDGLFNGRIQPILREAGVEFQDI